MEHAQNNQDIFARPRVVTEEKNIPCSFNIENQFDFELAKYLVLSEVAPKEMALKVAKEYTLIAKVCGMEYDVRESRHLLLSKINLYLVKYSDYYSDKKDQQLQHLGFKKTELDQKKPV